MYLEIIKIDYNCTEYAQLSTSNNSSINTRPGEPSRKIETNKIDTLFTNDCSLSLSLSLSLLTWYRQLAVTRLK
jgi:hypothetical protein